MALNVSLHRVAKAVARTFDYKGEPCGCVDFFSEDGAIISLFMWPEAAHAVADAFNLEAKEEAKNEQD